jgi:hypothetical protein
MKTVPSHLEKEYPRRGPLHQFRFREATAFHCFRCGISKKSKLITIYDEDWGRQLCNGCYGYLLSIYNIKAGTAPDDEKSESLANRLLSTFSRDHILETERLFQLSEKRARYLSGKALRFLATATHVSQGLEGTSDLDWSPAMIGLCKAIEVEVVDRLFTPLSASAQSIDLSSDLKKRELAPIAQFCKNSDSKPPSLGNVAFILAVAADESARNSSPLVGLFLHIASSWPLARWLLDTNGLPADLLYLTRTYRNKAAHIEELSEADYIGCREFVIGANGILWRLLRATEMRKQL